MRGGARRCDERAVLFFCSYLSVVWADDEDPPVRGLLLACAHDLGDEEDPGEAPHAEEGDDDRVHCTQRELYLFVLGRELIGDVRRTRLMRVRGG